jgi:hypothetical protein
MSAPIPHEDLVQEVLRESWELFKNDFVLYLLAGLLLIVVSIVSFGLLSGPLTVGFISLIEKRRRGETGGPTDVFDGFDKLGASLVASILIGVGVFLGLLVLVLPGVLFGFAMAFAFQAIAIENETATGAMSRSFDIVRENLALSIVFVVIVIILSSIGSLVVFGAIVTMPFSMILMTLAFRRLSAAT